MNHIQKVVIILSFISSYGCSSPEIISSSHEKSDGNVFISGIIPPEANITVSGIYSSSKCLDKQVGFIGGLGSGEYTTLVKGKYSIYKPTVQHNKTTGNFDANLPNNGGTSCNWGLSRVVIKLNFLQQGNFKNENSITQDIEFFGNSNSAIELAKRSGKKIFHGNVDNHETYYKFTRKSTILNEMDELWTSDKYPEPGIALITEKKDVKILFSPKINHEYRVNYTVDIDPSTGKPSLKTVYPNGTIIKGIDAQKLLPYKFYENNK